jgi:hypothetical protein
MVDFWFQNLDAELPNKFQTRLSFRLTRTETEATQELHAETIIAETTTHLILKAKRGETDLDREIEITQET